MKPTAFLLLLATLLCTAHLAGAQGTPTPIPATAIALSVPMKDGNGEALKLSGRLCLPPGTTTPRVVLFNHGKLDDPRGTELKTCDNEQAQWFLARGFAVAYVHRRGNGASGGTLAEDAPCLNPNWAIRDGLEGARDIEAIVAHLASLPQLRHDGMVVQGHSAGGWATIAFGAMKDPRVVAMLNFAGGRSCNNVGQVMQAMAAFAEASNTPMLWIYTANDYWFPASIAANFYKAYTKAGGKADFHALPPYGHGGEMDGHMFWAGDGASAIWGPIVEAYLKQRGVMGADGKAAP